MNSDISTYNLSQSDPESRICSMLHNELCKGLPEAESKMWHGHPVWFLDGNPVVGYSKRKAGIGLLFWSGQSFDEPELMPSGSFKAAACLYTLPAQVNTTQLAAWLAKAREIQWDYKNLVKRKGQLERLH